MKFHLPLVNKRNLKLFIRASFLIKQNNVSFCYKPAIQKHSSVTQNGVSATYRKVGSDQ